MSKKGKVAKSAEAVSGPRKPAIGKSTEASAARPRAQREATVKAGKGGEQAKQVGPDAERVRKERDGLTEEQVLQISRAIADPRRMGMLRAIAQKTATCDGMRQCAGVSAATLSHHMKQMEAAGLIETKKDGRFLRATLQKKVWKNYLSALKAIGD